MTDEFERRLRAAVRGERPEKPTPLDESLRALVEQSRGGPPAPSSERHQVVRADAPREESNG
jgi:hypothetical protein